jgi:hypothetical protein
VSGSSTNIFVSKLGPLKYSLGVIAPFVITMGESLRQRISVHGSRQADNGMSRSNTWTPPCGLSSQSYTAAVLSRRLSQLSRSVFWVLLRLR